MVKSNALVVLYLDAGPEQVATAMTLDAVMTAVPHARAIALSEDTWKETLTQQPHHTIFLLCTHGSFGEDGTLHAWLEERGHIHTHSSAAVCALLYDKHATKERFQALGIPTPTWSLDPRGLQARGFVDEMLVTKPRRGGSKRGIALLSEHRPQNQGSYLYEERILGTHEVSVLVIRTKEGVRALAPVARSRDSKDIGLYIDTQAIIDPVVYETCIRYAVQFYKSLECYGITKMDFVIDPSGEVWALEVDAIPGLGFDNASALAAAASGVSYDELIRMLCANPFRI